MLRIIALAILAIAPVVVFPLAALAQGALGNEGVQNEATKKFQAFLAQDWKRWMQDYRKWRRVWAIRDRTGNGRTIRLLGSRREKNICNKAWMR